MKRSTLLSLWFLIAVCLGTNFVAALTISSTTTTINGSWRESWLDGSWLDPGERHDTSGIGMVSSPHGWAWASASVDSFHLAMTASAPYHNWPTGDGGTLLDPSIYATAGVTTRFFTDYSQLGISLSSHAYFNYYPYEQDMRVTLRDITAATTLLDLMELDTYRWGVDPDFFNIKVDRTHVYELTLSGSIYAWNAKYVNMETSVSISELGAPVPESSSSIIDALLLLPFGLQGIRHFRNRKS